MSENSGINRTWRVHRMHVAPIPPEKRDDIPADQKPKKPQPIPVPDVEPTRIFDNLSIIGDEFVYCFVIETTEGLVMIDALYPFDKYEEMIESGIRALDMDPADVKAILLTHGHFDHYGVAERFQKKYGTKVYMAQREYEFYRSFPEDSDRYFPFEVDGFLEDGDDFTLGNTTIHCIETGGHSPAVLSYIFPVWDEGRPHMCGTWGGTGTPRDRESQEQYLRSAIHFTEVCDQYGCDVEVSNHPIIDNGNERLNVIQHITEGVANPFVIGKDAMHRYCAMFYDFMAQKMDPKPADNPLL